MAKREITKRIKSHGHEFVDALQKHWAKKGTANLPIRFVAPDGRQYALGYEIKIETINGETVLYLFNANARNNVTELIIHDVEAEHDAETMAQIAPNGLTQR